MRQMGVTLRLRGQRLCTGMVAGLVTERSVSVDVQELASIDHADQ